MGPLGAIQLPAEVHMIRPVGLLDMDHRQAAGPEHVQHPPGTADAVPGRVRQIVRGHVLKVLLLDVDDQQSAVGSQLHGCHSFLMIFEGGQPGSVPVKIDAKAHFHLGSAPFLMVRPVYQTGSPRARLEKTTGNRTTPVVIFPKLRYNSLVCQSLPPGAALGAFP